MSVEIEVKVRPDALTPFRTIPNPTSYTVTEDSTPIDPADTTGAAGTMSVGFFRNSMSIPDLKRLNRKTIRLVDRDFGTTTGVLRVPADSGGQYNLSADLSTNLLAVKRKAAPYVGNAGGYFAYLLSLVGIVDRFVVDPSFAAIPVVLPGWEDDVWLRAKEFAACNSGEISFVSNNIVFRPIRQRVAVNRKDSAASWTMDDTNLAQSVEGYWYDTAARTNALAYPPGGWSESVQVYTVKAGETIEYNLPISASLSDIVQPTAVNFVGRYDVAASAYCIVGNDSLPIPAAQWEAAGGMISVAIGEDTRSIVVTITGANIEYYSPFRVAASAGPSDNYSSLRILGTGVFYTKSDVVTRYTGVSEDLATREVGATLDSEFITSLSDLVDKLTWTLSRFSSPRHTLTVNTRGINRAGDSGDYTYPTFDDANERSIESGWATINDLNAAAPGLGWTTIEDFNAWWEATVAGDFANQAFGNVAGARTFRDGHWFRIRSAKIDPGTTSYTAELDTTAEDFNVYAIKMGWVTIDDFNISAWDTATFDDFNAAPLTYGMGPEPESAGVFGALFEPTF